MSYSQMTIGI